MKEPCEGWFKLQLERFRILGSASRYILNLEIEDIEYWGGE